MAQTDVALTELRDEVEQTRGTVASVVAFIDGLTAQLAEAADDPDEIRAITATLRSQRETLAGAIAANPNPGENPLPEPNPPV